MSSGILTFGLPKLPTGTPRRPTEPTDWMCYGIILYRRPLWDHTNVHPTKFAIISESVTQKTLNTPEKVQMELWSNGFIGNSKCNRVGGLCFASHAAEAFNMQLSSQITVDIEFASNVDYRLFAIQLQRVTVNSLGLVQASLD